MPLRASAAAFARADRARRSTAASVGAAPAATALTRLGPTYVKLGQFLATRPDMVGMAIARDLETPAGQDAAVPAGRSRGRDRELALGKPVNEIYESFGPPVAAASIAQVHRAEIETAGGPRAGRRQGAAAGHRAPRSRVDLDAFTFAARAGERCPPRRGGCGRSRLVDTLRRSVAIEMDLRLEAAALSEMARTPRTIRISACPTVDWDRTAKDVLTLDWIDGMPLTDRAALDRDGPRPASSSPPP